MTDALQSGNSRTETPATDIGCTFFLQWLYLSDRINKWLSNLNIVIFSVAL